MFLQTNLFKDVKQEENFKGDSLPPLRNSTNLSLQRFKEYQNILQLATIEF